MAGSPNWPGRRMIRWINHAVFLAECAAVQKTASDRLFPRPLPGRPGFVTKRWHAAPAGLPRFEALDRADLCRAWRWRAATGWLPPALPALLPTNAPSGSTLNGGIPSRNPEELLDDVYPAELGRLRPQRGRR